MADNNSRLPDYPIKKAFQSIRNQLDKHPAFALEAPTGSGKTTLLPAMMLNSGLSSKKILITQPRRIAAKTVALRISQLLDSPPGKLVGYRVRGESKVSALTKIEVVTEGFALAMLQGDPFLTDYDWVILDEFHERHIEGDLLLAFLRDLHRTVGTDEAPGIILMTATWQGQPVEELREFCFKSIEGRLFPVNNICATGKSGIDYGKEFDNRLLQFTSRALDETMGKILVFLPGRREIEKAFNQMQHNFPDAEISLLFGGQELQEQQRVIEYKGEKRQIILSTAIAETSLTIEGVTSVIDSGLERLPLYLPNLGLIRLVTRRVSRASAEQRSGRAGRLCPGNCYRLWTETEDRELIDRRDPEIISGNLSEARLQAALWGNAELPWVTPPPSGLWLQAEDLLRQLGAIDTGCTITSRGRVLATLPLPPRLGHMLLEAPNRKQAALAAVILSEGHRFRFSAVTFADKLAAAASMPEYSALRREANELLNRVNAAEGSNAPHISTTSGISVGGLLSLAFPDRLGRKKAVDTYETITGAVLRCRDTDAQWAVFPELTGPQDRLIGRSAEEIQYEEIELLHPGLKSVSREVTYLPENGRFRVRKTQKLGKIILKELPADLPTAAERCEALQAAVRKRGLDVLPVNRRARGLLSRLNMLRETGINDLPSGDSVTLTDSLEHWLCPWLQNDLTAKTVCSALEARLSREQNIRLESLLPRKVMLRPGHEKEIDYSNPSVPLIRGRIQEFYGLNAPLTIADGKITLVIEMLSPAMRPLQTTSDPEGFWRGAYKGIRSEMRGRYPKHYWPGDPSTAKPSIATGRNRPTD